MLAVLVQYLKICVLYLAVAMEEMKMKLRSSVPKAILMEKKPNLKDLPFISYPGKLHYHTDTIDCAMACDKILSQVNKSGEMLIIGFDVEWPFNFQTGPGRTALIQMSPSLEECFLFHVSKFKKLPLALTELLSHPNVRLAGVNIKNDIHKIARDFPGINSKPMLDNCIDSRTQAKTIKFPTKLEYGKIDQLFCKFKMQINKDKRVRNSKWNVIPLTQAQKQYAAIDAYASLKLYLHLKDLMEKTDEFGNNTLKLN